MAGFWGVSRAIEPLDSNIPGLSFQGSNAGKPDFFRLSFRNCISYVNNCEDLLYVYFFIPQFKYMNLFIISSSSFSGILQTNLMTSSQLAC